MAMDASNMMAKTTTFETFRQHQSDDLIETISSASDEQKLEQKRHAKNYAPCDDLPAISMTKENLDSIRENLVTATAASTIPSETDTQSTTKNKRKNFKPRSTAIADDQNETNLLDMRMQNARNDQRQQHRARTHDISSAPPSPLPPPPPPSTIIIDPSSHLKNNENQLDLESCGNYAATVGRKLIHISNSLSPTTLLNSLTELSHGNAAFETASDSKIRLASLKTALHSQNHRLEQDAASLLNTPWPPTSAPSPASASEHPQYFASNAFTAVQDLLSVYGLSMSPNDIVDAFSHRSEASAICDLANNGKFSNVLYIQFFLSICFTLSIISGEIFSHDCEKYYSCKKKNNRNERINSKSKIKCHQFYSL